MLHRKNSAAVSGESDAKKVAREIEDLRHDIRYADSLAAMAHCELERARAKLASAEGDRECAITEPPAVWPWQPCVVRLPPRVAPACLFPWDLWCRRWSFQAT